MWNTPTSIMVSSMHNHLLDCSSWHLLKLMVRSHFTRCYFTHIQREAQWWPNDYVHAVTVDSQYRQESNTSDSTWTAYMLMSCSTERNLPNLGINSQLLWLPSSACRPTEETQHPLLGMWMCCKFDPRLGRFLNVEHYMSMVAVWSDSLEIHKITSFWQ